jgi:predicted urease superfamily metal-dependent hydrolase
LKAGLRNKVFKSLIKSAKEIGQKIEFLHKEREEQERMEKLRE